MRNFFISYNRADEAWAEWVAWILEEAKYSVIIAAWDFLPGENFVLRMHEASAETERTVAILSQNYLDAEYTHPEWAAAFARDPRGRMRKLIPIRIGECKLEGLLETLIHIDVIGLSKQEARDKILTRIKKERIKPAEAPGFPGGALQQAFARVSPAPVKYPEDAPPPGLLKRIRNLARRKELRLASIVIILALIGTIGAYLYYGRCKVRTASTAISVTFDEFNKAKWEFPGTAKYDVTGIWLNLNQVPNLIFPPEYNYTNFEMGLHLKLLNTSGAAWAVRVKDEKNYYLFYLAGQDNGAITPGFYFYIVRNDKFDLHGYQDIARPQIANHLMAGREYQITVTVTGKRIVNKITPAKFQGHEEYGKEQDLGAFDDPGNFACGSIGFRTIGSGQFSLYQLYIQPN